MKRYIASFQSNRGSCWDMVIYAHNLAEAKREAKGLESEYGECWSVRLDK